MRFWLGIIISGNNNQITIEGDEVMEKITTTLSLEAYLRNKLKRIAKILEQTESSVMEEALRFYFENSTICREVWEIITHKDEFLEALKKKRITKRDGRIIYRPYISEEDEYS